MTDYKFRDGNKDPIYDWTIQKQDTWWIRIAKDVFSLLVGGTVDLLTGVVSPFERAWYRYYQRKFKQCGKGVAIRKGFLVGSPERLSLGDYVTFGYNVTIMCANDVKIGSYTMVASGAMIISVTHHPAAEIMAKTIITKPVTIMDNVWIGANAIILPGVTIGSGAIIGAGAVVTHDVPENIIVVGIPARPIRNRLEKRAGESLNGFI